MISFSIVICTYNPDTSIFERLLRAVDNFIPSKMYNYDIIIVDNNSFPEILKNEGVVSFLNKNKNASILVEKKAGLTNARIAGIKAAKGNWIIFFDDDNEPSLHYLDELNLIINLYPNVGCWGPGNIKVKFIGENTPEWLLDYKEIFQEKQNTKLEYSDKKCWQNEYPFGTGLCILKTIANEYVLKVQKGIYSLSDRKRNTLSSGGDVQIVLTAISLDYFAGTSPNLQINHLISSKKTTFNYLIRLVYGTASSSLPAHYQVFPEEFKIVYVPSELENIKKIYYYIKNNFKEVGFIGILIKVSAYLGELKGVYLIRKDVNPGLFFVILTRTLFLR